MHLLPCGVGHVRQGGQIAHFEHSVLRCPTLWCSHCLCHTMVLPLLVPHCGAPAAYAAPWCSCYLCSTVVLLLPVPHYGAPAACATLWYSCCLYCTVVLLLPVPHCGTPTAYTILLCS